MMHFKTLSAVTLASPAALTAARRQSERSCAQAALARYARETASRLTRDSRNARGAIDSPLFANV